MSNRKESRELVVSRVESRSPHLQRIYFYGASLSEFDEKVKGDYVKLVLPGNEKKMRTYTIAEFDKERCELALDFVVGLHDGYTTNWASNAKKGERVKILGPGPKKMDKLNAQSYVLLGDLTSLNAIRSYLDIFSEKTEAKAVIFVPNTGDIQKFETQANISVEWRLMSDSNYFVEAVESLKDDRADTVYFAAGESRQIIALKKHLVADLQIKKENMFISPYWRSGQTDEDFRKEKKFLHS